MKHVTMKQFYIFLFPDNRLKHSRINWKGLLLFWGKSGKFSNLACDNQL